MILATVKIWDINMFSQFSSKESAHCWLIFLQNFFYKKGFYPKNLLDLWPKIFKASKILQQFEMEWTEDEDKDGSLAKNLQRMKIFEALLQHWLILRISKHPLEVS